MSAQTVRTPSTSPGQYGVATIDANASYLCSATDSASVRSTCAVKSCPLNAFDISCGGFNAGVRHHAGVCNITLRSIGGSNEIFTRTITLDVMPSGADQTSVHSNCVWRNAIIHRQHHARLTPLIFHGMPNAASLPCQLRERDQYLVRAELLDFGIWRDSPPVSSPRIVRSTNSTVSFVYLDVGHHLEHLQLLNLNSSCSDMDWIDVLCRRSSCNTEYAALHDLHRLR